MGEKFLRKAVYAVGGVMGVLRKSSFLIQSTLAEKSGLSCNSEGKLDDLGVLRRGRMGLVDGAMVSDRKFFASDCYWRDIEGGRGLKI